MRRAAPRRASSRLNAVPLGVRTLGAAQEVGIILQHVHVQLRDVLRGPPCILLCQLPLPFIVLGDNQMKSHLDTFLRRIVS